MRDALRIIPAYAGSTWFKTEAISPDEGSSPHTRGAPSTVRRSASRGRIIPAYAGSTSRAKGHSLSASGSSPHTRGAHEPCVGIAIAAVDHPRIRGEHVEGIPELSRRIGSSPHTRGAPSSDFRATPQTTDHPRIRGEHWSAEGKKYLAYGIIPAYAGSTMRSLRLLWQSSGSSPHTRGALKHQGWLRLYDEDHPRIRGEHQVRPFGINRARGIIPAYAGSTDGTIILTPFEAGSSPHTRGAR